ncbi:MAG: hypothetical protein KatS3mg105_4897 [Gemmatales bacterium]|nr:MAG: hypothetical protein KatS3mg105_4897 [Gemmatales bacterium]
MERFWQLDLISLFTFYLGLMFLVSLYVRVSQYRAILSLLAKGKRWPRLLRLVAQFRHILMTWRTFLPVLLSLSLMVINRLANVLIYRKSHLTPEMIAAHWETLLVIGPFGAAMLAVDLYCTFVVGEIDEAELQKYFDQAERWLGPLNPAVHIFTLGFINPKKMVAKEVRTALIEAGKLIEDSFWWLTAQYGLRAVFGLSLWLSYAWIMN